MGKAGGWSVTGASAADTEGTITKAAQDGMQHVVYGISAVVIAAVTDADIGIELRDGSTVKWKEYFGSSAARGTRIEKSFPEGITMSENTAVNLVSDAGGANCIIRLNMHGKTV